MEQIKIHSAKGELALVFEFQEQSPDVSEPDYTWVSLVGPGINASIHVYDFQDFTGVTLWGFFEFMHLHTDGWQGEHVCESLEGDLKLVGTIDHLGKIEVRVSFNQFTNECPWKLEAILYLYQAQLPDIIRQIPKVYKGDW